MTAYLIVYGEHPGDRFAAYAYPSRAMARAASLPAAGLVPHVGEHRNAGGCAYVIEKTEDITFSGRLLVEVYNALTCKNVMRFNDRAKGLHLLMQALEALTTMEKHMITVDEPTRADTVPLSEPPKQRKQRSYTLGNFAQVRRNSEVGRVLETLVADSGVSIDEVSEKSGTPKDKIITMLKRIRGTHGIDHKVELNGSTMMVTLIVPDGQQLFKETKDAPRTPRPRTNDITEKARQGIMPEKPIVTSATNAHRQKHFDRLAEYAENGEWDKVRAYEMKGIDTYSKMINRYRDQLLLAHEAAEEGERVAA